MSLSTDIAFVSALNASEDVVSLTGGRIYGTAIPVPDEDLINTPVPYIIVTFNGLQNNEDTKDYNNEGDEDTVQIGLEITAPTLKELHELAELVRTTVREYMDSDASSYQPIEYTFSASSIEYDSAKPCYWVNFTYNCITYRDNEQD